MSNEALLIGNSDGIGLAATRRLLKKGWEIHGVSRKLVAGTYGRGAWEIDLPPGTGVGVSDVATAHPELLLDPPSPNPVRDRTRFRFASWRPGPLTVDVHDVTGRRVARVAERAGGDGIVRSVEWIPDRLAAGVYFAVLRSGGESVTRKIVLAQ